jgi:probable O-glycosylation ligase (exosortase A-associated)
MMGLALAMNVPLLIYLLRRETNRHMKWVIRAMIVLSYPAVVCTFSRGAWIGLAAGTALMVLRGRKKFVMVVCLSLAAILAVPYLPDRVANRYDDLRNYQGERSAQSRFWNWEFCRRVGFSNPLTGGGFNFYSIENYARYYPEFLEQWPGMLWTCHSAWLTVLGEHGILAFLLWLSLILASLLSLRRLRAYARSHPETPWPAPFADSVQAAILVFLIVATFLDAAYFDMFYELIAAIVIAKDVVRREARRAAAPKPDFEPAPMAAQLRAS